MAALSTNNTNCTLGENMPDDKWMQSMHQELDHRISALHDDCTSEKNKQQEVFAAAMVKLPRNIRNMTVAEFNCLYRVNLLENLKNPNLLGAMAATSKALQTPGTVCALNKKNNFTPSRTARKGEMLYSQNGSPVESDGSGLNDQNFLVATVAKPATIGDGVSGAPRLLATSATASLSINVGNGQFVSLKDSSGVVKLGANEKNNALLQLQLLKEQVDSAMKQLEDNQS
eukprot:CAMPEP_0198146206 /NCGR_PEP_ID=MMETSP1443-20131203/28126_1 /TAXON_ID=186043 /ORGANISM="Entomoneis sp., Strain CCMP2396" /LENGTH=228 /DNA_ID=CAMNT_0043810091 /DNA_START=176 /DNA_END=862 /DNA_ORIENTATION=-